MEESALPAAAGGSGEQGGGVGGGGGGVSGSNSRGIGLAANAPPFLTRHVDPRRSRRSEFHARVRADALARQRAARGEGIEAARSRSSRLSSGQGGRREGGDAIVVDDAAVVADANANDNDRGDVVVVPSSSAAAAAASAPPPAPSPPPRPFWARQLMRYEWMVDAPDDLARNW